MKNIKLVAFDIDGTLIPRGQTHIPASTKEAIHQLKLNGIQICVATGRSSFFIQKDVIDTIQPDFYVTVNGQLVTDKNFNPLVEKRLDLQESLMILNYCRDHHIGVATKMEHAIDVYHDFDHFWPVYLHGDDKQLHILKNKENDKLLADGLAPFGIFMIGEESKMIMIEPKLKQLALSYAYPRAYEIFDKNVGKGDGLEYVIDHFGFTWDEVCVFGDANNDIYMIEKAGLGIAMGNASHDCKEAATYVISACDNDGILNALKHFNIID